MQPITIFNHVYFRYVSCICILKKYLILPNSVFLRNTKVCIFDQCISIFSRKKYNITECFCDVCNETTDTSHTAVSLCNTEDTVHTTKEEEGTTTQHDNIIRHGTTSRSLFIITKKIREKESTLQFGRKFRDVTQPFRSNFL